MGKDQLDILLRAHRFGDCKRSPTAPGTAIDGGQRPLP